jgi:hypothetical protein
MQNAATARPALSINVCSGTPDSTVRLSAAPISSAVRIFILPFYAILPRKPRNGPAAREPAALEMENYLESLIHSDA